MVDICARLGFFLWLHETFVDITPEQALLAQLNDGRRYMKNAFQKLCSASRSTLDTFARYCAGKLSSKHKQIRLAIDEAQQVTKHCCGESEFHFGHHEEKRTRGLLYEYVRLWKSYVPAVVVAGTGLTNDAADQVQSSVGKNTVSAIRLPFLKEEDIKARLEMLLDVSDVDWDAVDNLGLITGRCRWVATTVLALIDIMRKCTDISKEQILDRAIFETYSLWVMKLADDLNREIKKPSIRQLCKVLHAVAWLFDDHAQGMRLQFDGNHTSDILTLGVALLASAAPERPDEEETKTVRIESETKEDWPQSTVGVVGSKTTTVMMDTIGLHAIGGLGDYQRWNPAEEIANRVSRATNIEAVEFVYGFETLVAAAIVRFEGTIEDLIRHADPQHFGHRQGGTSRAKQHVPAWTKTARFNCKYRVCETFVELTDILEEYLQALKHGRTVEATCVSIHPCKEMRHDYIAIMLTDNGEPFLFTGSANCASNPLAGADRDDNFDSTMPEKVFMPKRGQDDSPSLKTARRSFKRLQRQIAEITGGRCLRLHVTLPGYACDREVEAGQSEPLVKIDDSLRTGNASVRVIIDQSNYSALFCTPGLRGVVERIMAMQGRPQDSTDFRITVT